jgi:hypothetical protein
MVALKNMFGVFSINDILSKNIDKKANTSSSKTPTQTTNKKLLETNMMQNKTHGTPKHKPTTKQHYSTSVRYICYCSS